jgi:acyl-CoA synthetase (AMP-forming)/AMP-acid ligase II
MIWSSLTLDYQPGDVMYNCLPLYHSNALILAAGSAICGGVGLALARKFSRRQFWDDIQRHDATAFIYIGELCRYLLSADPSPREREHKLRVVTGNGLRPELWQEFKQRFGIRRVAEFYAATEGNCVTINLFNRVGSVGPRMPGMRLARVDPATQQLARGPNGFLQAVAPGEPGILLGRINRRLEFSGYRNADDTERKIVRDAFELGDAYFNTGDLLRMDQFRHLSFVDRLGDTFRWKGENVATGEVEAQLAKWPAAAEVNVYGVQVPGADGRAGMAAVVLAEGATFDPAAFRAHVDASLPAYARPLFVRLPSALSTTATFKLKKGDLQREGFDPTAIAEPLYMRHPLLDQYVPLDRELFARLAAGELKL